MTRFRFKCLFLGILLGWQSFSARAEVSQFCSETDLRNCQDLDEDSCRQKYYACGLYEELIGHFATESQPNATARYFKGISYYGLYVRNRALSLKCRFSSLARSELTGFTVHMKKNGNLANPDDIDRLYQTAKILNELKNVRGCLEQPWSADELRAFASNYADERLQSIFLSSSSSDGLATILEATKRSIRDTISGFVSKAAKAETQLAMRENALSAGEGRLEELVRSLDKVFGSVKLTRNALNQITSIEFQLDKDAVLGKATEKTNDWAAAVTALEDDLNAALSGMDIEEYEKSRNVYVGSARELLRTSRKLVEFQTGIRNEAALGSLLSQTSGGDEQATFTRVTAKIQKDWHSALSVYCTLWNPAPWYCPDASETFNALPNPRTTP